MVFNLTHPQPPAAGAKRQRVTGAQAAFRDLVRRVFAGGERWLATLR